MFLFFNIITKFTSYYYTITHIKLINYYWHLCQCSNLSSFRINVLILSGILVRSFSNPEILAIEISNSSMFKSRDNDLQNITIKTKDQVTQTPLTRG